MRGFSVLLVLLLVGCDFPKDRAARETATREVGWLKTALLEYKATYGIDLRFSETNWPQPSARIIGVLTASPDSPDLDAKNPKRIRFLLLGPRSGLMDPWGNSYEVAFAGSNTSIIMIGGTNITVGRMDHGIAVWSPGPNGINEWGKGDDVNSWE